MNMSKAFNDKKISWNTKMKISEIFNTLPSQEEKEALAKQICDIIETSQTEEEMVDRVKAVAQQSLRGNLHMSKILTDDQILLRDYFREYNIPKLLILLIIIMLWDEEATLDMIKYLAETSETDPDKLYSVACEIEEKYKVQDSFDEDYYNDNK